MNTFTRIILSLLTVFCLFILVYFTFIAPNYLGNINSYKVLSTGLYSIGENSILSPEVQSWSIKVQKLDNANNIYFQDGTLDINENDIILWDGIYLLEFNEVQTNYSIQSPEFEVYSEGPWSFIINNTNPKVFNVFSISGKINVIPKHPRIPEAKQVHIQVYPNMYFITNKNRAVSYNNVDLNRVQQLSKYDSITWGIYFHPIAYAQDGKPQKDENGKILVDTKTYQLKTEVKTNIFNNNDKYDNFIKNIYAYKSQNLEKQQEIFDRISHKQFYNFPGEDYISMYFDYFLNDEKKKYYYKNLILKKLIVISNGEAQESDIDFILEKLESLKALSEEEYKNMLGVIQYYYDNILYTQKDNTNIIIAMNYLYGKIHRWDDFFLYHSLVNLNYVYENKILWVPDFFNKNISVFMELYLKELANTPKTRIQEKYSYYIFFIKNLIYNESKEIWDYNNFVKIFQQYVKVFEKYIGNANPKEIETQIFNNAQLIEVFTDIMRKVLFQNQRNDRKLLEQIPNALIDYEAYKILKQNLKILLDFFGNNKNAIDDKSTPGSKEEILLKKYARFIDTLEEFFLAMDNYPEYELKYDKAVVNIDFWGWDDSQLSIEKAKNYLYQFQWSVTQTAEIKIRNFWYCNNPEAFADVTEAELEKDYDPYCYEVKKIEIDGMIFSFILNPNKQNEISYLSYINKDGEKIETTSSHIMDRIQDQYELEYKRSQSDKKEQYNFAKFFTNNYSQRTQTTDIKEEKEDIDKAPPIVEESLWVEILKRWLMWENAPLKSIQSILPISYRYLLADRQDDTYIINVFPTDFTVQNKQANNYSDRTYTGKFSGRYNYKSQDHYFSEVVIQPIGKNNRNEKIFIFENAEIQIIWDIYFTQLEEVLLTLAKKQKMLEYFYKEIWATYWSDTKIDIYYNIDNNSATFEYNETKVEILDNGQANKYKNGTKIKWPVRYSTIDL